MSEVILVVDDDPSNRLTIDRLLRREGYSVFQAESGRDAMSTLRSHPVDLILTDFQMPGMTGLELLQAAKAVNPDIEVVVMTAFGTVEVAVEAMKEGAYDFVAKPLKRIDLVTTIRKALERRGLQLENRKLREQLSASATQAFIGQSQEMRGLLEEVEQVAPSDATVMLSGESGTGKGRIAKLIHELSRRKSRKMITVNCAALPENLLESELFGYEKGAFTGATSKKDGRFDLARGGTLFLDEITEIALPVQVKLLRVLQEGEYERVGGTETLIADVRIIAATNRNIEAEIETGRFRQDLYYRLNVIRLEVPSLKAREGDIQLLAQHFLATFSEKNRKTLHGFTEEAMDAMTQYPWPGNVRELENAVERAVVLSTREYVDISDLPKAVRQGKGGKTRLSFEVGTPLKTIERKMIEATLKHVGGDKNLTANLLGITARTIYRREAEWAEEED